MKKGNDSYFEEQRAYRAYSWWRDRSRVRVAGAVGTIGGIISTVLAIYRV